MQARQSTMPSRREDTALAGTRTAPPRPPPRATNSTPPLGGPPSHPPRPHPAPPLPLRPPPPAGGAARPTRSGGAAGPAGFRLGPRRPTPSRFQWRRCCLGRGGFTWPAMPPGHPRHRTARARNRSGSPVPPGYIRIQLRNLLVPCSEIKSAARRRPGCWVSRAAVMMVWSSGAAAGATGAPMTTSEPEHLSNHHRNTLRQIFQHPVSHNIEWHAVVSLLEAVGSTVEQRGGKVAVTIGSETEYFDPPAHNVHDPASLVDLRLMVSNARYGVGAS